MGTDVSALGKLLKTPVLEHDSDQTVDKPVTTEPELIEKADAQMVVTRAQSKRAQDNSSMIVSLPFTGIEDDGRIFLTPRREKKKLTMQMGKETGSKRVHYTRE